MIPSEELRHVLDGPRPAEQATGAGLVRVRFDGERAEEVLARSREVMTVVLEAPAGGWPSIAEWSDALPRWFVTACAPEDPSAEERWLDWWRSLGPAQRTQAEREKPWTLGSWLSWLEPDERQWFWWDAAVESSSGHILVQLLGWPAPIGALAWLLQASGATEVE